MLTFQIRMMSEGIIKMLRNAVKWLRIFSYFYFHSINWIRPPFLSKNIPHQAAAQPVCQAGGLNREIWLGGTPIELIHF